MKEPDIARAALIIDATSVIDEVPLPTCRSWNPNLLALFVKCHLCE
jgi:hypothetical protein